MVCKNLLTSTAVSYTHLSYKPSDIGYEGALQHLWNKDITYQEFLNQVKTLKGLNTDWYDLLFRRCV